MTSYQKVQESFQRDTANHSMEVLQDDGVTKRLKFSRNGSSSYHFQLVTWPGYLCICGDMGDYLFYRTRDMFEFFGGGTGEPTINPGYWGEKLQAEPHYSKYGEHWSIDAFKKSVNEYLENNLDKPELDEDSDDDEKEAFDNYNEIQSEVKEQLESIEDEYEAVTFIRDFECNDFVFSDFWEYNCQEHTFHYLWCLHAIVWGIQQYDKAKKAAVAA